MTILTQVLNGLQLGSIYALVALGYTMVYGIILLLNFAHGDIIMVGAYISWIVMSQLGLNPVLAIVLSIVGCAGLGVLIDKVAYQPLREAPRMSLLITAIGVSYFLENGAQLVFGADAKVVPEYFDLPSMSVGGVSLSANAIITIVVTAISCRLEEARAEPRKIPPSAAPHTAQVSPRARSAHPYRNPAAHNRAAR